MKTKILTLLACWSAISFVSCNKDLGLLPETSLSSASFFKNREQYDQALVGAYTNLRLIALTGIYMDEMRSDNTFFTRYAADRGTETSVEAFPQFLDDDRSSSEPNNPGNRFGNDYSGIAKTNTILTRITHSDIGLSEGAIDSISAEALFLRAFYYYDLVTHYGGVPLMLEEVTAEGQAFSPRNTVEEVYDQIIGDLEIAVQSLPVATTFPQSGRATKGAADMLLAYAYMSKPQPAYDKAEVVLREILGMKYGLLDNYADVFDPAHKNNKESIFEVQYKQGNEGQQSDFAWRFIPKTTNPEAIMGVKGTNLRGGLSSGGWNVPTQEMVDSYEPGDARLPASIGVAVGSQSGENFTTKKVVSPVGFTPSAGEAYYYFIKKYLHPPYQVEWNTGDNFPVFRYAGALLLLSECLVEEHKNAAALPYINQVRLRANLKPLTVATAEAVANERRHELAFENHRWVDLIRNGTAVATLNAKGERLKKRYGWMLPAAFTVTKERLVYAIPFREIEVNDQLVQNEGY